MTRFVAPAFNVTLPFRKQINLQAPAAFALINEEDIAWPQGARIGTKVLVRAAIAEKAASQARNAAPPEVAKPANEGKSSLFFVRM